MSFWQNWRERRARRRAEWQERLELARRAVAALAQMGTLEANAGQVDLVILRAGVHVLEINARFGPVFLVPMASTESLAGRGGEAPPFGVKLH